ncbi:MAG: hypothetical protein HZA27_04130 [Candidatus Omnitrophica bacterium]|nr:hypothetical protein [Candidatus Omnitrophota bacterium]
MEPYISKDTSDIIKDTGDITYQSELTLDNFLIMVAARNNSKLKHCQGLNSQTLVHTKTGSYNLCHPYRISINCLLI